jgi:DNA helicase II / ATP-dependent DNA helicase PcrA
LEVYNPRNKTFAEQEEVQGLLGALLAVLDPDRSYALDPSRARWLREIEPRLRAEYERLAASHDELRSYVRRATASIAARAGEPLDASLQELVYFLISLEPFSGWQNDPARRARLGRITALLEAFSSMPVLDVTTGLTRLNVSRGFIKTSSAHPGRMNEFWIAAFYNLFIGYVVTAGLNDEEEADVIVPAGMVPVMTMHQAKGLEFPFVFVGHMGETGKVSATHRIETVLAEFPSVAERRFERGSAEMRADTDLIRQYYVAYSRAMYALVLVGTRGHFDKLAIPGGPTRGWLNHRTNAL